MTFCDNCSTATLHRKIITYGDNPADIVMCTICGYQYAQEEGEFEYLDWTDSIFDYIDMGSI